MAIIKCKMCGGDLTLIEGQSVAECEYCGSRQTVPTVDNEKKLTLFARANRLRAACDFDKAAGIYEAIVADFPEEAESYWGLVLCKYGIEYVDDPATGKKIPTCHRSSFDSVMDDSNFEQAMENADEAALRVYRQEAKQIEGIRKGILEVSSSEEPYDIFICYKETDSNGSRTVDSLLAQDIYDALTIKGYRVFFSRITLEDKLGRAYEPYIFAALNSAKIMLAVGTSYEHYNAVWVKNEWSRYLKSIAQDKNKYLIPCYKDLDAYDMPKEFQHLQGQDMGKVGAIADLLRGIEKLLPRQADAVKETVVIRQPAPSAPDTESLLARAFMFLEDGAWDNADAYCEKVLDINPQNARAYLGKLLAELKLKKTEELQNCAVWPTENTHYQKVLRFADRELQSMLQSFEMRYIRRKEMEEEKRKEREKQLALRRKAGAEERQNKRRCANYNLAIEFLEQEDKEEAYSLLKRLPGYKDADTLLESIRKDVLSALACVKRNDKYGYINEAGEMVIEPQFDYAGSFESNGLARVKRNGKFGFINEAGEMVIAPQFDGTYGFAPEGLAAVRLGNKWSYINEVGEMVIAPQFDGVQYHISNGYAYVGRNGKYGYINKSGEMVIEPQFDDAKSFASNGLACVKRNGKYGYINKSGEMVIEPQFDGAESFASNGLACVELNGKYGYINKSGEMVMEPQFDGADSFASNGLARVKLNGKYGYISEAGEMVMEPQFDYAESFDSNGLALVDLNGKYAYINEAGEMVIEPQNYWTWGFASNGLAQVDLNGKYGYINEAGEMVIELQFDCAESFASNGLARVKLNDKYGYINEAGEMVIPPQFDSASDFTLIFRSKAEFVKQLQERKRAAQQASRRAAGFCQHCGGALRGIFSKKCVLCGKPKDY